MKKIFKFDDKFRILLVRYINEEQKDSWILLFNNSTMPSNDVLPQPSIIKQEMQMSLLFKTSHQD